MLFGYKILAFCTSRIYQDRFCSFLSGLNDALSKENWRIMVFTSPTDLHKANLNNEGSKNIFDLINFDITDAVLISNDDLFDPEFIQDLISKSNEHNIPSIVIGGTNPNNYNICFDEKAGFEHIVRHIIEDHKVKKIHFLAGTHDSRQSQERLEVTKKVMAENHLSFTDENISYGDFWDGPARKATEKLFESNNIPEAIICANDTMAITVLSVMQEHNYKCPEQILISGFDGIEASFFSIPKITTGLCDFNKLGKEAADFITQIIEQKPECFTKYVDVSLIVSESCGCKPQKTVNTMGFINFLSDSYNRYRFEDSSLMNMSVAIQSCKSLDDVKKILKNQILYNIMCLIKAECINEDASPNENHSLSTYGEIQYVLLDSDYSGKPYANYIKTSDLIPRMQVILDEYKMPLLFTPLNNLNQSIGYLCFCFCNYDKQNYAKVNQIASWLSNAITGFRNMQYQQSLQREIENMYSHDTLTGLYNRIGFQRIYKQILNDPEITTISLAMCDLDNLKHINDTFTHNEGDSAIKTVGQALSTAFSDGYYCRYGGDEIIALYPYEVDAEELQIRIDTFLKSYNNYANKPYEVSTSLGVYTSRKTSFEEMFGKADKLMYQQKTQKKLNRKQ